MSSWPTGIDAITLFVEDLEAAKRFYSEVFSLPVKFEDDSSVVIEFGNTLVNLLGTGMSDAKLGSGLALPHGLMLQRKT
jgi:catechol-2,3-dioxygenase